TDHGRIRLYVSDTLVQETTNTTTSLPSLAPTDIKLGAQLVCTDSSPFNPEVWHNITISVGEPTVKILNPGRPLAVSTAGVRVAFSVTRFALAPANYAGPRIPGAGHIHILRNGTFIGTSTTPFADLAGVIPGPFNLTIELHNNDHSLLVTSTHRFGYNDTIAATTVVPSVRIVSPATLQTVSASGFRLTVSVVGIDLDFENYGGTNIPRHGHIHVYEGGSLLGTTTTTWFDATLGTGDHTLRVELRNNDHTPLSPAVSAQITVHVGPPELKILEPVAASSVSAL